MVKLRVIKKTPTMKIGEIIIIKNKKGAQMYVDEGVAEYYNDNSKIKESKVSDIETFIKYFDHKNFWLDVFKPNINGERPRGLLTTGFFKKKDKKALIKRINDYNGKGIVCLAVNDREDRDKTIKTIDTVHSLVIDVDVKKSFKQGFVSLPEHHEKALDTARNIKEYLQDKGFKISLLVDSGNGAQIYIYLNASFSPEYIEERKKLYKDIKDDKKLIKEIQLLVKNELLFQRIETFEKDLKSKFNESFIEIDNITKDLNRRMKIAGTINKKDEQQIEDRVSQILYFNKEYKHDDMDNISTLEDYEVTPVVESSIKNENNKPKVQTDIQVNYRLNKYISSRKSRDKEFIKTFKGENLEELYSGDRSAAEQSIVNSLYFRGFQTLENINQCMEKCKIGKWQDSPDSYKELTFKSAKEFAMNSQDNKKNKRLSFKESLKKYSIYILSNEQQSKYLIHNNENQIFYVKKGKESLSDYFYLQLKKDNVNLNQLISFFPDSNKSPKNLLYDYLEEEELITPIHDLGFKPIPELTFYEDGKKVYNTYRETQYLAMTKNNENINIENFSPCIYDLLFNITGKDIKAREYLIKLLAFIMQNPHIKTQKLVVMYGEEGSGKGITFNHVIKPLLEEYAVSLNQDILDSPYNGTLSKKIVVYFNEVENKKENANILKSWITEPTIQINEKYGGMRNEKSYFTIFADVNGNNPITAGNRRTVYFKSKTLGGSFKMSQELGEKYVEEIPKELPYFAQYLQNLDVNHSEIREGYETQAKTDVLDNVKTLEQQFTDMMDEYSTCGDWLNALKKVCPIEIGGYIKEDWLEVNFLLDAYNIFRRMKGYIKPIVLNRFSWIYDALDLNRRDSNEVRRMTNTYGRKVFSIKLEDFQKRFKPLESEDKVSEDLTIKSEDLNKITEEVV